MFLHALLFFLLSPSVFAAPAGSSSHGHDDDNVKSAIGYWYPVEAKENASPPQVLQIVSATVVYSRELNDDGSLNDRQDSRTRIATNQPDPPTDIISVLWRRFPKRHTPYTDLTYLKIEQVGQQFKFDHPSLKGRTGKPIGGWADQYWYEVSGSTPQGLRALVFDNKGKFASRLLGSEGGVIKSDLDGVIRNFDGILNPFLIGGYYYLLPGPDVTPGPYHDVMTASHDVPTGKCTFTVQRYSFLAPEQQHPS